MTKRERALLKVLKRLRDALWNSDIGDSISPASPVNRAYIAADSLIATIEREQADRRRRTTPVSDTGGAP